LFSNKQNSSFPCRFRPQKIYRNTLVNIVRCTRTFPFDTPSFTHNMGEFMLFNSEEFRFHSNMIWILRYFKGCYEWMKKTYIFTECLQLRIENIKHNSAFYFTLKTKLCCLRNDANTALFVSWRLTSNLSVRFIRLLWPIQTSYFALQNGLLRFL
jgi:hypothetical protein